MKNKYVFKLVCICILLLVMFVGLDLTINFDKYKNTIQNANEILNGVIGEKEKIEDTEDDDDSVPVLSEETISLSHYGNDCHGCTDYTASGYYVGDGRIHYDDPTFGTVRIVAADKKYPLGSIVRIKYYDNIITAIVLDRGGAIGDGKKFQIDLLVTSEKESYELGIIKNTDLEVLRLGY